MPGKLQSRCIKDRTAAAISRSVMRKTGESAEWFKDETLTKIKKSIDDLIDRRVESV
jgi:hypothetical protein